MKFLRALCDPVSEYFHQRGESWDAEVRIGEWEPTENRDRGKKRDVEVSERDKGVRMGTKKKEGRGRKGYYTWLQATSESI